MARRSDVGVVIVGAFLAASVAAAGIGSTAGPSAVGVWLDSPLDGSVFDAEIGAIRVVGHVVDAVGVDRARLDVDGATDARASLGLDPGQLLTVEFEWLPAPGTHVLELWARNAAGRWVGPAIATVTVEGEPPPSSTTTTVTTSTSSTTTSTTTSTTSTTSSTTTSSTTTGACLFTPPDPVSPADGHVTPLFANTLSWAYSGCRPALEFEVEVSSTPIFIEIFASAIVVETSWLTPSLACDTYWWRVRPVSFDGAGPWSTPWSYTISSRGC